jgi:hypothetical protein
LFLESKEVNNEENKLDIFKREKLNGLGYIKFYDRPISNTIEKCNKRDFDCLEKEFKKINRIEI